MTFTGFPGGFGALSEELQLRKRSCGELRKRRENKTAIQSGKNKTDFHNHNSFLGIHDQNHRKKVP